MKRLLRLGDCYVLIKLKPKKLNIRYISLLAVMIYMCASAVQQVSAQKTEPASTAIPDIKPLQIGDTIPEYLWHLPLQVVNHPDGKETITLNDYRGKLIILDFWATWCKGCLAAIPALDKVQSDFKDDVTILSMTNEPADKVVPFLRTNQYVKSYDISSVVNYSDVVEALLPHRILPHLVWISKQGVIIYASTPEHVTTSNIERALSSLPLVGAIKKDIDTSKPLFLGEDIPEHAFVDYYSIFITGLVDGLPGSSRPRRKENVVYGHYFSNFTLKDIYREIARESISNFSEDRIVYELNQNDRLLEHWKTSVKNKRIYTLDFILPKHLADSLYDRLLSYLNKVAGYSGQIKMLYKECYVLSPIGDADGLKSKGGKTTSGFTPEGEAYLNNVTFQSLSNFLRSRCGLPAPVIIEGVPMRDRIDIKISSSLSDFPAVQEELRSYGLSIVKTHKEIPMFVISK